MTVWEKLYRDRQIKDNLTRTLQELNERVEEAKAIELQRATQAILSRSKKPSTSSRDLESTRRSNLRRLQCTNTKPTFQPVILPSSARMVSNRLGAKSVFERLYSFRGRDLSNEHSIDTPRAAVAERAVSQTTAFMERQRMYLESRKSKETILARMIYDECSFTPRISSKSEELALHRRRDQDVVKRLAVEDVRSRQTNHETLVMLAEPECRFVPEINNLSDAIATMNRVLDQTPVHERLYTLQGKSSSGGDSSDNETENVRNTASARPRSAFSHIKSHYNLRNPDLTLAAIDTARRHKESAREQASRERSEKELAECTFQPRVNRSKRSNEFGPVLVPGLDKFIANQHYGRRLSESGKLIGLREYGSSGHDGTITVPLPFMLSGTSDDY